MQLDTPVALILFNRPESTARVFEAIRDAAPRRIFLIADGPRETHPGDVEACAAARAAVRDVDWDCRVYENFSSYNLGCGLRPSTGISWVFEHVDRAIILEDDCLPHPSFFRFCEELLGRYAGDERIMLVSGNNFIQNRYSPPSSYFFNRNIGFWGWATWRRAWQHFDMRPSGWPDLRETGWLEDILGDVAQAAYWRDIFERAHQKRGTADHWDYQWTFAVWSQNGLAATPSVNLVSNIGFGAGATHTRANASHLADLPVRAMEFPLEHPLHVVRDRTADDLVFRQAFHKAGPSLRRRLRQGVVRLAPAGVRRILRHVSSAATSWSAR